MPDRAGRFAGPRSFLTTALRGRYYDDSILQIRNLRLREAKQLSSRGKNVLIVPVYFPDSLCPDSLKELNEIILLKCSANTCSRKDDKDGFTGDNDHVTSYKSRFSSQ